MGCRLVLLHGTYKLPSRCAHKWSTAILEEHLPSTVSRPQWKWRRCQCHYTEVLQCLYSIPSIWSRYKGKLNHHSSLIMANWPNQGLIQPSHNPKDMTPGQVQYYFLHSVALNSERCQHLFAYVLWFESHPEDSLGKSLQVWYKNVYQTNGPSCFIPVQWIATSFIALSEDDKMIICPVVVKQHI